MFSSEAPTFFERMRLFMYGTMLIGAFQFLLSRVTLNSRRLLWNIRFVYIYRSSVATSCV